MGIKGHKEADLRRDEPAPSGSTVQVVSFVPRRKSGRRRAVPTVAALRRALAPFAGHERLVVYLDRDGGESGSVWVHLTGDRAWVTHFTEPGGEDSYCCEPADCGTGRMVEFLLSTGQSDSIHRSWTVSRAEGLQALEHFVQHGERDTGLRWAVPEQSLQEPVAPQDEPGA